MDSVRSILIRTCMANIQKEIGQLEHWLLHLPTTDTTLPSSTTIPPPSDLSTIFSSLDKLSKQLDGQQHALNHIIDRIDILESTREVHIQELPEQTSPWIDEFTTSLENEPVDDHLSDLPDYPIYTIHKTSRQNSPSSPSTPLNPSPDPIVQSLSEQIIYKPLELAQEEVQVQEEVVQVQVQVQVQEEVVQEEVVQEEVVQEEVVQDEVVQVQEVVVQDEVQVQEVVVQVQEEVVVVQVQEEVVQVQEEEEEEEEEKEEEEEEEGVELEEIEYKGVTYYKDNEGFIYSIDEEGQPSDTAVGYWKEKTQLVAFYKSK